ncbi:MAG: UbiX family flavin prenyltransferase [Bacteroidales bacterium]|nr:UbiX family flavin prenyltransferase [Bacteroidales bacterium]
MTKKKIIVGITGASGSVYAKILLEKLVLLKEQIEKVVVVFSETGKKVWKYELKSEPYENISFEILENDNLFAPPASGSARFDTMLVCPCSMGTLGRIANGISNDLITRAADVILKERRKLILVTRESPISLIHINNMKTVTEAGGIICPASPSFYTLPQTIEELATTVVDRVIDLALLENDAKRWENK